MDELKEIFLVESRDMNKLSCETWIGQKVETKINDSRWFGNSRPHRQSSIKKLGSYCNENIFHANAELSASIAESPNR